MTPRDDEAVTILPADGDFSDLSHTPCEFWYFGTSYATYLALTDALPRVWRVAPGGKVVNDAASRLLPVVADLDDHLFPAGPPIDWWASRTAECAPYVDDLYLSLAQGVALVEAARQGGRHVVMVEDPDLGWALAATLRKARVAARWRGGAPRRLRVLTAFARSAAAVLRDGWRDHRAARRNGLAPDRLAGRDVWLLTWVGRDSFAAAGPTMHDDFLGALPAWLNEWGVTMAWLGNPAGWLSESGAIAEAVTRAAEPAAVMASFIPWTARLGAILRGIRLVFTRTRGAHALGIDLSPLIRRAMDRDASSGAAMRALAFRAVARQCRRSGAVPQVLIYTYENQPWERQLLAGFREQCPQTRLIGFQHTIFADRYVSTVPSRAQLAAGLVPDLFVTSGEAFRDRLAARGVAPERLAVGGALRFPDLSVRAEASARTAVATILATLPMHADEGLELAHKGALATAALASPVRLLVNFHPMMESAACDSIRERIGALNLGDRVAFVDGPARGWLGESDLVLYNSSGTVFDATRAGVPAVYVGPTCGLDLEKLPGGGILRCRTAAELVALVERLRDHPAEMAEAVRDAALKAARCFATPDREVWRHALNLDAGPPNGVRTADIDRGMGERRG